MYYHLGIKSEYSLLEGLGRVKEYVTKAKEVNQKVLGFSDVNNLRGSYEINKLCHENNIIPLQGIDSAIIIEDNEYSIQLFAYSREGLKNLTKISSKSFENMSLKEVPRIDLELLKHYSNGIFVVEGGPDSFVQLNRDRDDIVKNYLHQLKEIFNKRIIFELRLTHKPKIKGLRETIKKYSKELKIPYYINCNVHYTERENGNTQEIMMAAGAGATLEETPQSMGGTRKTLDLKEEYYFRTEEELIKSGFFLEEDIKMSSKTLEIIFEKWISPNVYHIEYNPDLRPHIKYIPNNMTEPEYFDFLIEEGFELLRGDREEDIKKESRKRIDIEREVIKSNDFISYFLVVRDFIKWSEDNGYPVGAGRGSIAGSEIGFLLGIHKTDPIKYDLMFERFLSPGRGAIYKIEYKDNSVEELPVSTLWLVNGNEKYTYELNIGDTVEKMNKKDGPYESKKIVKDISIVYSGSFPDVDTDFHTQGRYKVMEYVKETYGEDCVANIGTFGTLKPRAATKMIARTFGVAVSKVDRFNKILMEKSKDFNIFMNLYFNKYENTEVLINKYGDIMNFIESEPIFDKILKEVHKVLGLKDHTGVHAAGVVISGMPLEDHTPTQRRYSDNAVVTQWEAGPIEAIGLIKMDFLGLDTVDLIDSTYKLIKERHNVKWTPKDIYDEKLDMTSTYELFQKGDTIGIFQFAKDGVTEMLKSLKPEYFIDLAMSTAIYRPGPLGLGYHHEFAKRKTGESEAIPIHPSFYGTTLEDILKETYGMCVFQEQVMQIAAQCADFTPYETDQFRKALGKKKVEILNKYETQFKDNMLQKEEFKGMEDAVDILWTGIVGFGEYAFNKSHSVSYAINSIQVAYMKANYPLEFFTASLSQRLNEKEDRRVLIRDAQEHGINIYNVSVNSGSDSVSIVDEHSIALPLTSIKGLNKDVAEKIMTDAPYKDIYDFFRKTSDFLTDSVLEKLAISGALDIFGVNRYSVYKKSKQIIKAINKKSKEPEINNIFSQFGINDKDIDPLKSINLRDKEFPKTVMTELEGMITSNYLNGTPSAPLNIEGSFGEGFTGVLTDFTKKKTKKGNNLLILTVMRTGTDEVQEIALFGGSSVYDSLSRPSKEEDLPKDCNVIPLGSSTALEKGRSYYFREDTRGWRTSITEIKRIFFMMDGTYIIEPSPYLDYLDTNLELKSSQRNFKGLLQTADKYKKNKNKIPVEYNNFIYLVPSAE